MSVTNKALLNITRQDENKEKQHSLSPADIPNVESKYKASFFFAIGVLSSLSLIGWSTLNGSTEQNVELKVSEHTQQQALTNEVSEHASSNIKTAQLSISPTKKESTSAVSSIYAEKPLSVDKIEVTASVRTQNRSIVDKPQLMTSTEVVKPTSKSTSIVPATPKEQAQANEMLQVEEVELLPSELAHRSREAAKKALDRSDFKAAMKEYYTVLKYQPSDEESRKRLAALLYGKRDVSEAAAILQQGIKLNDDSVELRLALSSLLQKEQQPEAALSVLEYIPVGASVDYLATRGGLAQQLKLMDLAKESYQMLVNQEPDNGRWWLGLAIVYEREAKVKPAYEAYQTALIKPGLSRSSQAFVRDRIKLLATMEGIE
ncbi:MSHA biogenesis protein MshN [Aliivibrio fischeri]|uniref:tetratricopeptide repeat protein n=1 Tax=Aliivibrio fischeri TaxID=668 RepID=UPI0007C5D1BB|nr:tetratricopeptide repeat protein [Aliivibrio fischeri]MCE7579079.1 MSHA biogenesis protein MshN [Aliivibrio fischeri]MCE7591292.1 MSHA biogenesis protein MshN [Aliivibrio fischeri]